VRLLRVVQDDEVIRVGGERPVRVNVRIVAATHRDLPAMVESRAFREDLYYRLAVFPIVIPPLRDRVPDIRRFAEYFAQRAADRFGLRPTPVSDADVLLLADYPWPGNVRELAAVMDRAVLVGQGRLLDVAAALGRSVPSAPPASRDAAAVAPGPIAPLDVVIARHIEAALRATHGRVEGPHGAARLLGINPHTLRARIRPDRRKDFVRTEPRSSGKGHRHTAAADVFRAKSASRPPTRRRCPRDAARDLERAARSARRRVRATARPHVRSVRRWFDTL
jgi:transcriptional regulator with GAF, ATPase, and Fis domain